MGSVNENGVLSNDSRPELGSDALQIVEERNKVHCSYDNATVLNSVRDKDIIDGLKDFISGTPIKVQWYNRMHSSIDDSSLTTSISFMSSSVNTSLMLIKDMEILLRASMEYSFDEATNISTIKGSASMYPGFTPSIGDVFLYHITPGDIGIFRVSNNPRRLSIRNNTSYIVDFTLVKKLDDDDIDALRERVRETMYFSKQRFLHTDGGLLTEQEVVDLKYIHTKIEYLKKWYDEAHYNKGLNTFMKNEQLFDPYVVLFFKKAIDTYSQGKYINTPAGSAVGKHWERSVFAHILGEGIGASPILRSHDTECRYGGWSSLITMLQDRSVVELVPDIEYDEMPELAQLDVDAYISPGILSLDAMAVSEFDKLVTLWINNKALSYDTWKQLVDAVDALPPEESFYVVPIYIYLGMRLIAALERGASIALVPADTAAYINIPFTSLGVETGIVTIATLDNPILGLVDAQGVVHNLGDDLVTYGIGEVEIDIVAILDDKGLETVDGEWFLVASNNLNLVP